MNVLGALALVALAVAPGSGRGATTAVATTRATAAAGRTTPSTITTRTVPNRPARVASAAAATNRTTAAAGKTTPGAITKRAAPTPTAATPSTGAAKQPAGAAAKSPGSPSATSEVKAAPEGGDDVEAVETDDASQDDASDTTTDAGDDVGGDDAPADEEGSDDEDSDQDDLEARVSALEQDLAATKAQLDAEREKAATAQRFSVKLSGYVDVGFFGVQGNGSGVRKDVARDFPGYQDILATWVLVGDPLSTAINSRGDVADLGDSRAIRFDPVHSQGRPTFLINNVNVSLAANVGEDFSALALVDLLPRFRDITDPAGLFVGDYLDVKLAWARWRHRFGWGAVSVFVGKTDSILGLEYRTQEAPTRITVTPSLICRYTCGRPVGLTVFGTFLANWLEVALALTNGAHQVETFPFSNEVDWNRFKTGTGRLALRLPVGKRLELNVSGAIGPQDRQPDDAVLQWHVGVAGLLEWDAWHVSAEFVTGRAVGKPGEVAGETVPCARAACLDYRGAYGQVAWFGLPVVAPYVRVDWRDAAMRDGRNWAYVSNAVRATVGLNARLHTQVLLKAEYVFNRQVLTSAADPSKVMEFPDDVFTSSLVLSF